MPEFSVAQLPEVFVSDTAISKNVHAAVAKGQLRKIGSRLYTRNLTEDPEKIVRRNWYGLVADYFPDAVIADRTALENKPAEDGSIFLISAKTREVALPGIFLRPRTGPGPLESDRPLSGVRLASTARAYLENMRLSRARGGRAQRTLPREDVEKRLDALLRRQDAAAINRIRDDARRIAPELGYDAEFAKLDGLIGSLLGTREAKLESEVGKARNTGEPFDPNRLQLFETLMFALRDSIAERREAPPRSADANATLAFFEAYFSNFIEGTEFSVDEAAEIVFEGVIPAERPADAHDVLGTFRVVSDIEHLKQLPASYAEFRQLLRHRHAMVMEARPDKGPGAFKAKPNQAGMTVFVAPDLVEGTLERGYHLSQALGDPLHRAIYIMALVSEVHPFADGNGRIARIMMNAELVAAGEERIIIPTAYRTDYLTALKAFTHNARMEPVIRMLSVAQGYTSRIDWSSLDIARANLAATNAFDEGELAKLKLA